MSAMTSCPDEPAQPIVVETDDMPCTCLSGTLQSRNVRIHKRRTSVRLEPAMWSALNEIAALENCSIHDLCGAVYDLKEQDLSFTAALRVFMMEYYRAANRAGSQVAMIQKRLRLNKVAETEAEAP